MATFNGADYVIDQLLSIEEQTVSPDQIVIVDDASTDATPDLIAKHAACSPLNIHLLRLADNLGSTGAFEVALRNCTGDFIALCDQDDVWRRDKLEVLLAEACEARGVSVVYSNASLIDERGEALLGTLWSSIGLTGRLRAQLESDESFTVLFRRNWITGSTALFRREVVEAALPFPALTGDRIHDGWLALIGSGLGRLRPVEAVLVGYRQHPQQQLGVAASVVSLPLWTRLCARVRTLRVAPGYLDDAWLEVAVQERLLLSRPTDENARDTALLLLWDRDRHFQMRRQLPTFVGRRFVLIARELLRGGYRRHQTSGWSPLKDLMYLHRSC